MKFKLWSFFMLISMSVYCQQTNIDNNVNLIINQFCQINIDKIEQFPSGTYNEGKCFTSDEAGNQHSNVNCKLGSTVNNEEINQKIKSDEEIEEIKNNIYIYPNPTRGEGTITWKGSAINKIHDVQIYNNAGLLVYDINPSYSVTSANFNLTNQLPGVYVIKFILNTGQVVIKNLLKW